MKQNFNDPSKFWQIVRSINQKSVIHYSITSEQWYEHSEVYNVFGSLPEEDNRDDVMEHEVAGVFYETISRDEVTASKGNLEPRTSAGLDEIISEMLKHADQSDVDFLVQLFNKLCDEEYSLKNGPDQ